ncbi:hypothetical protein [Winogradskyella aurantia]|uniref:hypothetical protein n=1 Tax=Winogradskyella aurantia TaxID=1915063 RepID=UPI001F0AFE7B|nr:hypothetical protein [Winogradskyella aurantia]
MKRFTLLLVIGLIVSCSKDDSVSPVPEEPIVAEFRTKLSELNLYTGAMKDLNISSKAFKYQLNTPLFTDYAQKERLIALPEGGRMRFNGEGLPIFPDNTLIAKTFYYNIDNRDVSLGRQIIETRILIKSNGEWTTGNYKWNEEQTDALLDLNGSTVPVTWINDDGISNSINYVIPSDADCFTCHKSYDNITPIGPKLRSLNFEIEGANQIQRLLDNDQLFGLDNPNNVNTIVNWEDTSQSLESRARAYFDVNCAHCHIPGGFCEDQSILNLDHSVNLSNSFITERKASILSRVSSYNPGFSMPLIGTTIVHDEGLELIESYLNTL